MNRRRMTIAHVTNPTLKSVGVKKGRRNTQKAAL
jgi:hypothetical protein